MTRRLWNLHAGTIRIGTAIPNSRFSDSLFGSDSETARMDIRGCSIDFTDKTALVTGSSRGIGRSIADLLSELGARVIYTGTKRFCDVASGETKEYWQMDATSRESVAECQARILDLPKLDILVNNAGINQVDSVDGLLDEDWDRMMEVNLTTPMKLMRAATKVMKNARSKTHLRRCLTMDYFARCIAASTTICPRKTSTHCTWFLSASRTAKNFAPFPLGRRKGSEGAG